MYQEYKKKWLLAAGLLSCASQAFAQQRTIMTEYGTLVWVICGMALVYLLCISVYIYRKSKRALFTTVGVVTLLPVLPLLGDGSSRMMPLNELLLAEVIIGGPVLILALAVVAVTCPRRHVGGDQ